MSINAKSNLRNTSAREKKRYIEIRFLCYFYFIFFSHSIKFTSFTTKYKNKIIIIIIITCVTTYIIDDSNKKNLVQRKGLQES